MAKKEVLSAKVDKKNFVSLQHYAVAQNLTSGLHYLDAKEIELVLLLDEGVLLKVPNTLCAVDHSLLLSIMPPKLKKKYSTFPIADKFPEMIEVVGKVEEIMKFDKNDEQGEQLKKEKKAIIKIKFTQYDINGWKNLLSTYAEQQKKIGQMLTKFNKYE